MLTPKQIKNNNFQAAGRNAYKASEVDEFMEEVYDSYEQMFRENAELVKKLGLLADKVSEYKSDEDNIRNALLTAERMKESILAEAQEKVRAAKTAVDEKTSAIIENARAEADKIIAGANDRADETLKLAQSNATKLLAKAQEIYDEQVNTVKEQAEKEREYLNRIKEESAKVRAELMDTYKTQMDLLRFTPDFSEEVAAMHEKKTSELDEETLVEEEAEAESFEAEADTILTDDELDEAGETSAEDLEDESEEEFTGEFNDEFANESV